MRLRLLVTAVAVMAVVVTAAGVLVAVRVASVRPSARASPTTSSSEAPSPTVALTPGPAGRPVVYVYYYMWWTPQHWQSKLGPKYPLNGPRLVAPGSTNAQGCNPTTKYPGATIVDLPQVGLYNQNLASTYETQISQAAQAGVTGFLASWQGTGTAHQSAVSSGYDQRLALLVHAVNLYNQVHPTAPFYLGLAFSAFGDYTRPASQIEADLTYFSRTYGRNPAFRNSYSSNPIVVVMDSRKYSLSTVSGIWNTEHASAYLVGDETSQSWARDQPYLDATSYYWSSEDPWTNTAARSDLISLGKQVRAAGKRWFAPFIPGYNKQLLGGSCVPRDGVATMAKLWSINAASGPQGWFGISWNEFVENTYLQPSLNYGSTYLRELKLLIEGT
ncbi:MAG TPA: hypothetical protein VNF75_08695 [Candidatus Dormibacteraeota bacterium]|nr:hypothetical protein [Candidatus Dormibacteraeota bacterium]